MSVNFGQVAMLISAIHGCLSVPNVDKSKPLSERPLNGPKQALAAAQAGLAAYGVTQATAFATWTLLAARSVLDLTDSKALNDTQLAKGNNRTFTRGALLALATEFPTAAAAAAAVIALVTPDNLVAPKTRENVTSWVQRQVTELTGSGS